MSSYDHIALYIPRCSTGTSVLVTVYGAPELRQEEEQIQK